RLAREFFWRRELATSNRRWPRWRAGRDAVAARRRLCGRHEGELPCRQGRQRAKPLISNPFQEVADSIRTAARRLRRAVISSGSLTPEFSFFQDLRKEILAALARERAERRTRATKAMRDGARSVQLVR